MTMMSASTRLQADIQGLRAVAVSLVLAFHLLPYVFPGGYIGVDVFFVISGFVISRLITKEVAAGQFSLQRFYLRRLWRLTPPLLLMLLVTLSLGIWLLLPAELVQLSQSTLAAMFYFSNWLFASDAGYFSESLANNPLLHTWSLGVEEQFYLLFPLLLVWLLRTGWSLQLCLPILTVLLYLLAWLCTLWDADVAFFASPLRFFQFTAGAMLVHWYDKIKMPSWCAELFGWCALLLLLGCTFLFNKTTAFPGTAALLPTAATLLLLLCLRQPASYLYRLLTLPPLVWTGNISYSLYLWHWPVIVFAKLSVTAAFSIQVVAVLLLLSFLLGFCSWYLVERPIRQRLTQPTAFPQRRAVQLLGGGGLMLLVLSLSALQQQGWPQRFTTQQLKLAGHMQGQNKHYGQGQCFMTQAHADWQPLLQPACFPKDNPSHTVLLVGDSHAAHLQLALRQRLAPAPFGQITMAGCKPLLKQAGRCGTLMDTVLAELATGPAYQTVILAARWQTRDIAALEQLIQSLPQQNIIVVGPLLSFELALPRLLIFESKQQLLSFSNLNDIKQVDEKMIALAGKYRFVYYSMFQQQCKTNCMFTDQEGVPLQWDTSHLTKSGAVYLMQNFSLPQHD